MSFSPRLSILAFIAGVLLTACGGNKASNSGEPGTATSQNSNSARTSVEELDPLITLPYEAEDCVWKSDPSNKRLTAVLRFDSQDTVKLLSDLEKLKPGEDVAIASQPWFPSDLIVESDMRGDDQLRGKAYAADPFYKELFTAGRAVRVAGTDYFVVELEGK